MTRLGERGVDAKRFEIKPCEMIADEALRTWFATPGGNDYLLRLSHPWSALRQDFPYHLRKATKTQLDVHTPKPEPRRPLGPLELVSPDNPLLLKRKHIVSPDLLRDLVTQGARKVVARPRFG